MRESDDGGGYEYPEGRENICLCASVCACVYISYGSDHVLFGGIISELLKRLTGLSFLMFCLSVLTMFQAEP